MAAFNLADALGLKKVSNLDTTELTEISIDLIDPNPNNFFEVEEDVSALCESIEVNGLLQPPVVTPAENSRYRLIAGHRRHKAMQALAANNPEKYKTIMCQVVRPASPALEELMLIQTNTEAREINHAERIEAVNRIEKILIEMQQNGVVLPGKMRSHVAKLIKSSESQIARAKFIDKNLIRPLKGKSGISDSAAYKLAHLPEEQQQELYEHYKRELYMLDGTRIQRYLGNIIAGKPPFYVEPPGPRDCYQRKSVNGKYPKCDNGDVIEARKKSELPDYQKCGNRTCCSYCEYRFECEDVCAIVRRDIEKHKATDTYRACAALKKAREAKGMNIEAAAKKLNCSVSQMLQYESNLQHTAASLIRLCRMYDVTPNEILGFGAAPSSSDHSGWIATDQVGDLVDGLYFMLYEYNKPYVCDDGKPLLRDRAILRRDGQWYLTPSGKLWNALHSDEKLVAVLPAPPIPEGWSLMFAPMKMETEELEIVAEDVYDA